VIRILMRLPRVKEKRMPELPEVETVVRGLRGPLVGRRIVNMWQDWPRALHSPSPAEFAARVRGQTISAVQRRGKYILIALDHDTLLIHLKMTGRSYVAAAEAQYAADKWVHLRFDFADGGQLRFSDPRKFGRAYLTADVAQLLGHLGPEPLDENFRPADLEAALRGRKRAIKALLLQQEFLAGVGNIYADEALFRAGIHPACPAKQLDAAAAARLHGAIRAALRAGIQQEGASINWYRKPDGQKGSSQEHFFVYGRAGRPCKQCGGPINKVRLAQRGTHFCPDCQPAAGCHS